MTTANEASVSILQTTREAVVGHTAKELFGGANEWVLTSLAKVSSTGVTDAAVDADLRLPNGNVASVNLAVVPLIDPSNQSIGTMLILDDITREKRMKSTMSRYMSKEVADQVLEAGETLLGGKDQRVSILFSDIRNFTHVAEELGARETVAMLNEYFSDMVDVVFRYGGILDKYIGDSIMAVFGSPLSRPDDADHAVAVANQMLVTLQALNQRRISSGRPRIDIGVGIATGQVIAGSIGSPKRMEYTAIGDSVNLASRLEGATKVYGVKILISESTVRDLQKPVRLREIDLMRVKGKDQPVAVYEALDHYTEEAFPRIDGDSSSTGFRTGGVRCGSSKQRWPYARETGPRRSTSNAAAISSPSRRRRTGRACGCWPRSRRPESPRVVPEPGDGADRESARRPLRATPRLTFFRPLRLRGISADEGHRACILFDCQVLDGLRTDRAVLVNHAGRREVGAREG